MVFHYENSKLIAKKVGSTVLKNRAVSTKRTYLPKEKVERCVSSVSL